MTQNFKNYAAWQPAKFAKTLEVREGPKPEPKEDEVVIKVFYAGIAPSDWKIQHIAYLPLTYPHVTGSDVAGIIVQTGSSDSKFTVGDRVIGHCAGLLTKKATDGAFQHYATVKSILVSVIPDSLPLANGAVLPLAIGTAAAGLYSVLKLPLPSLDPVPNGKTLLIWGGSSSVGSATIQLAIASGFKVISTASPKNFDYVKSLGATTVLDYGQENIVEQIFSALEGETLAGVFDAIGAETSARASAAVVSKYGGGKLALALWAPEGLPENVDAELVLGLDPGLKDLDIGEAVWGEYVPQALAKGKFRALPGPEIIKGGLEKVQYAINLNKAGVSAKKLVVEFFEET